MNRIDELFTDLRRRGRKALMPYLTVGDPDLATTGRLLGTLESAGASVVELGIPFSDPIADGPVIQASMSYALERGLRLEQIFEMVAERREQLDLGLVAMTSYSIVHRIGIKRFTADAAAAGFDGLVLPDLPLEEATQAAETAANSGLILSMLIAPTTADPRAQQIARASSGFVYVLSRIGLTGEQEALPPELPDRIRHLQGVTDLPIAVGFGISHDQHVRQVVNVADAAIVGTAVMRRIAEHRSRGSEAVIQAVDGFTRQLAGGLTSGIDS